MNLQIGTSLLLSIALLGCQTHVSGLKAISPPVKTGAWDTVMVTSFTPTLRWEAFPRPGDRERMGIAADSKISNVSYEVKISAIGVSEGTPIFDSAKGLLEPCWTTRPLHPCQYYHWTNRAHFEVDGSPRVTQWSQVIEAGQPPIYDLGDRIWGGFEFRTPN